MRLKPFSLILGRSKPPQDHAPPFQPDASGQSPVEVIDQLAKLAESGAGGEKNESRASRRNLICAAGRIAEKHGFLAATAANAFRCIAEKDEDSHARWEALYALSMLGENNPLLRRSALETLNRAATDDADLSNRQLSRVLAKRFSDAEGAVSSPMLTPR